MTYLALKHLHISFAVLSISLFVLRGGMLLAGVDFRRYRPLRWLPHLNDSLLLAAAIGLAAWSAQYPWQQAWLAAKVLALLAYIGLGKRALAPGLSTQARLLWLAAALLAVLYIVAVALSRQIWPGV